MARATKRWINKATGKQRRYRKRVYRMNRSLVSKKQLNTHHFKRTLQRTDLTANSSGGLLWTYSFLFSHLPSYTEFSTLYDQYRINKIVAKFIPTFTGGDINPVASYSQLPNFHSVLDFDDDQSLTSLSDCFEYSSYKFTRGGKIHTRAYTPTISTTVTKSDGTTAQGMIRRKQWLDMAQTSIKHYGLKGYIDSTGYNAGTWRVIITVYFSCRCTR